MVGTQYLAFNMVIMSYKVQNNYLRPPQRSLKKNVKHTLYMYVSALVVWQHLKSMVGYLSTTKALGNHQNY